jgi:transmembrane protein 132
LLSSSPFKHSIKKNWEMMNTAVLTGRQVSQVMKVFIVTQAGKVADVTLQSSCQAEDESVIKVSGIFLVQ